MVHSKNKGGRGEREFARWLKDNLGVDARRGQQYSGNSEAPDVVHSIPGVHFEVKRVERLNVTDAVVQAIADCGEEGVPVVAHRRNHKPWLLTLRAEDLRELSGIICDL